MPVLAMSAGRVTAIWGSAYLLMPDGALKPLHVGDNLAGGQRVITDEDGVVQISPIKGAAVLAQSPEAAPSVDRTVAGIEAREPEQVTAAGLTGGVDGSLGPGLRVDRVVELTSGALSGFEFGAGTRTADVVLRSPINQLSQPSDESGVGEPSVPVPPVPVPPVSADDRPYVLVQSGEPAIEGAPIVFDVVLTHATNAPLSIRLDLQNGTDSPDTPEREGAIMGVDTGTQLQYLDTATETWLDVPNGAVTMAAGQTLVQVRVATIQDNIAEDSEFIKLHAHVDDTSLTVNTDHANQTAIIDDKPYLLVESGEPAVEGQPVVFDLKLTHAIEQDLIVHLDLQSGTDSPDTPEHEGALLGVDTGVNLAYLDTSSGEWLDVQNGTVTMAAGQTLVQVRVASLGDQLSEDTEFIKLHAHVDETGLTANTDHANQTAIVDDKPYMLVQSGEPAVEGQPIVFDVTLTHATDKAVTVALSLGSGVDDPSTPENESATLGLDTGTQLEYLDVSSGQWTQMPANDQVTFNAGETLVQVRVATSTDNLVEDTEFIKLQTDVTQESASLLANASQFNQTAIIDTSLLVAQPQALPAELASSAPDAGSIASSQVLDLRDVLQIDDVGSRSSNIEQFQVFDAHAANTQIVATLMDQGRQLADQA